MSQKIILIVDDMPELLRAFTRSFTMMGHVVFTATNAREALKWLGMQRVDLVVTDYEMPDMKGDELCRQIKAKYDTPVILLSAHAEVHSVGKACGADACHSKPVATSDLQASLDRLCARGAA